MEAKIDLQSSINRSIEALPASTEKLLEIVKVNTPIELLLSFNDPLQKSVTTFFNLQIKEKFGAEKYSEFTSKLKDLSSDEVKALFMEIFQQDFEEWLNEFGLDALNEFLVSPVK